MSLRTRSWLMASLLLALFWAGCVGTDLVDELPSADARIELDPPVAAVEAGNMVRFNATYYDAFGEQRTDVALQWESADPSIATVDAEGVVQAVQVGQVMIWAKAEDATSNPALVTVVADQNVVAQIVVSPENVQLDPGQTQTFTAVAQNINGEIITGVPFTWSSSDPTVATIDNTGTATGLQPGVTEITATTDGVTSAPIRFEVKGGSRRGEFTKRPGTSYNVKGHVILEQRPGGKLVARLESDFSTSQGPGVHIYLSRSSVVTSSSIDLGPLRSFSGGASYDVPASVELNTFDWVIIHCKPFNVTFGYAQLQ